MWQTHQSNALTGFLRNKQHIAIVIGLGAMYPVPDVVRSILAPKEGETKRILDLGLSRSALLIDQY